MYLKNNLKNRIFKSSNNLENLIYNRKYKTNTNNTFIKVD